MKATATATAKLGQGINVTPQLLASIRLLQLTAPQLELEVRQALDSNPMLETAEDDEAGETDATTESLDAALDTAAWDELPDPAFLSGGGIGSGDDDASARIADGGSSDWRVRVLEDLALRAPAEQCVLAAFWLDHTSDAGLLEADLDSLRADGTALHGCSAEALDAARDLLLHGDTPGLCATDAGQCLRAQLLALPDSGERALALAILDDHLDLLARHDGPALARALGVDQAAIAVAVGLILSLRANPVDDAMAPSADPHIIPDVVVRFIGGQWRVLLNGRSAPRVRVAAHCEAAVTGSDHTVLRGLLDEARWLVRGIAMRNDTLLRSVQVLVTRQRAFLEQGEEAIAPLTLREVADAIGMHESTVSRIVNGKYVQTPRGTFELKRFFAVRLEGAEVSGSAVKAMVKRLIDAEPAHAPLADDVIAGMLARQGIRIARRTVAKYRDQLHIGPARLRGKPTAMAYA